MICRDGPGAGGVTLVFNYTYDACIGPGYYFEIGNLPRPKPSSTKNKLTRRPTVLPTGALQFRTFVFIQRIAEAEISDEAPVWGDIKNLADDSGIED